MSRAAQNAVRANSSSSLNPFSATALSFTRSPAACAASMPLSTLARSPRRVMVRNLSASSVSSETFTRRTPAAARSPANRASWEPLVVRVSSSSAPLSR